MRGLFVAFGSIWAVTAVGWLIGRLRLLGDDGEALLARLVFFVAAPALLFPTLARSSAGAFATPALAAFVASTAATAAVYLAVATRWPRSPGEKTIGALSAAYVNAGNLGIPVAVYALGDVSFVAPVLLFQLLVATPTAMAVLEADAEGRRVSLGRLLGLPARNPIILSSAAGIACALAGWLPPADVLRPFDLIGQSAVPLALLALGASLRGSRPLRGGPDAAARYTAVALKVAFQPGVAYLVGRYALGLDGRALLAAVVTAGLPTAQNVFVYATRYRRAESLARDAIVLSTLATAVTLLLIGWLIPPSG